MMVRRYEFLALGGFYEPIFMYGEEADFACVSGPKASSIRRAPSGTKADMPPVRTARTCGSTGLRVTG